MEKEEEKEEEKEGEEESIRGSVRNARLCGRFRESTCFVRLSFGSFPFSVWLSRSSPLV